MEISGIRIYDMKFSKNQEELIKNYVHLSMREIESKHMGTHERKCLSPCVSSGNNLKFAGVSILP